MATSHLLPPVQGPPANDPLPGMMLGDYKVERAVAAGGMGIVYQARHPLLGRKVAIKVLRPEHARNSEQIDRFLKEAQAISAIHHRGIIDVINFANIPGDGRQYMVMEFLEGETLEQLLARDSPLHPNRALPLVDEILDALSAAHQVGVVHRDLKPSNVFLTLQSNGTRYCKLVDFGLAKHYAFTGNEVPAFAKASLLAGTPEYISPEQARGLAATPRTDLYCVGIILFEMLTGGLPFVAPSLMELLQKQAYERAPRVGGFIDIPGSLDDLVASLLEKDPELRPRSAEVVRQAIARIMKEMKEASTAYFARPLFLKSKRGSREHARPPDEAPTAGLDLTASEPSGQPRSTPDQLGAGALPDTVESDRVLTATEPPAEAPEVKSDGRGKKALVPGPLPPEVKSDGKGKKALVAGPLPPEVKSDGRGRKALEPRGAGEQAGGRGAPLSERQTPTMLAADSSGPEKDTPPMEPRLDAPSGPTVLEGRRHSSPTLPRTGDGLASTGPGETASGAGGAPDRFGLRLLAYGLAAVAVVSAAASIWLPSPEPEPADPQPPRWVRPQPPGPEPEQVTAVDVPQHPETPGGGLAEPPPTPAPVAPGPRPRSEVPSKPAQAKKPKEAVKPGPLQPERTKEEICRGSDWRGELNARLDRAVRAKHQGVPNGPSAAAVRSDIDAQARRAREQLGPPAGRPCLEAVGVVVVFEMTPFK